MLLLLEKAANAGAFGILIDQMSGRRGYCHSEIVLGDGSAITSLTDTGLTRHRREYRPAGWTAFDLGGGPDNDARAIAFYEGYRRKYPNAGYDWRGVERWIVPSLGEDPTEYFCSESSVDVVEWSLARWAHVIAYRTSPNDLLGLAYADRLPRLY
jgi:hypothetical protein